MNASRSPYTSINHPLPFSFFTLQAKPILDLPKHYICRLREEKKILWKKRVYECENQKTKKKPKKNKDTICGKRYTKQNQNMTNCKRAGVASSKRFEKYTVQQITCTVN